MRKPRFIADTAKASESGRLLFECCLRLLCLLVPMLFAAFAAAAPDAVSVVVEIDPEADVLMDERITRRLIALELSDVEVPPRPQPGLDRGPATLFFRILLKSEAELVVELWERGSFYGKRRVSVAEGGERLRARRVALAAAELVRRLRQRRLAEAKRLERLEAVRRQRQRLARLEPPFARLTLRTAATAGLSGPGDFWLLGPSSTGKLEFENRLRLGLGLGWLFGALSTSQHRTPIEWLELSMSASYVFELSERFELEMGSTAAAAVVNFGKMFAVDDILGQRQSWSARAGSHVALEAILDRDLRLSFEPSIGILLREVPIETQARERQRLAGTWFGASLGLILDPAAPPRR